MKTQPAPSSTAARLGAWAMLVLGILGVLLFVAGILGVWALNTPATDVVTGTLTAVLGPLETAQSGLDTVDGMLTSAQASITELQGTVAQVGAELQADSLILKKLAALVGEDLLSTVDRALESLGKVRLALEAVQGVLDGLAKVPFIELPAWTDDLSNAIDEMERAAAEVRDTLAAIEAIRQGAIEQAVASVTEKAGQINTRLETTRARVQSAEARLAGLIVTLEGWNEAAPGAIDVLSVVLTVLLAWMVFAQWVVLSLGWGYVKTARWIPFYPFKKQEAGASA